MNNTQQQKSKAFELVEFVWRNEKTSSYLGVNTLMQDTVNLAINALFEFAKDDITNMYERISGGYWFGANTNGKGMGEGFYSSACRVGNISACQSYESFYEFKPFISSKGKRLSAGYSLRDKNRRYKVTGFDFDTKRIHLVSYDIADWKEEGKRKLHNFDNKEWNEFRKQVE